MPRAQKPTGASQGTSDFPSLPAGSGLPWDLGPALRVSMTPEQAAPLLPGGQQKTQAQGPNSRPWGSGVGAPPGPPHTSATNNCNHSNHEPQGCRCMKGTVDTVHDHQPMRPNQPRVAHCPTQSHTASKWRERGSGPGGWLFPGQAGPPQLHASLTDNRTLIYLAPSLSRSLLCLQAPCVHFTKCEPRLDQDEAGQGHVPPKEAALGPEHRAAAPGATRAGATVRSEQKSPPRQSPPPWPSPAHPILPSS